MTQRNNILQELQDLDSSLAANLPGNPYTVPEGYFDTLSERVLAMIRSGYQPGFLDTTSKVTPYEVPAGYFEGLSKQMLQIVGSKKNVASVQEELESISPLLGSLKKQMPYSIPAGYFDSLHHIPEKKSKAKVFSMPGRKLFRYAAAAVLTGAVALTVVLISVKEKLDPAVNSYSWVEKKMKKVSTDEIENFVEMANETLPQKDMVASADRSVEVKEMIKDIPATEIQEFLSVIPQEESNLEDEVILN
jgi:hypothetical protein